MTRFFLFIISALLLAASVDAQPKVITADTVGSNAERFTKMLDRSEGWLGADGIYSIPLNGNDQWGSANKESSTVFLFSDTMLGTADPVTKKYRDVKMVNHSAAMLTNYNPSQQTGQSDTIKFIYGQNGNGNRSNLFEQTYWLQDGIVIDKKLHLTAFTANAQWKPMRIDMLTIPLSDSKIPHWDQVTAVERFPFLAENERFLLMFGAGILDHTATDGFVYVYGYRDTLKGSTKHLVAARVKPESFADGEQWRFWNGTDWVKDCTATFQDKAVLAERVSTELSVTPIGQGKFLLIFTQDVMSDRIAYKVGTSPIGPFGETVVFYRAPEPKTLGEGIYVYNAKAHPHLSRPGWLLISYNVNRLGSLPRTTNEYRPRFIELPMEAVK